MAIVPGLGLSSVEAQKQTRLTFMPNQVDLHIGAKLRMLRRVRNLSLKYISRELGISFQQIQKYEQGENRVPSSRLWELACVFEVNVNVFFDGLVKTRREPFAYPSKGAIRAANRLESIEDPNTKKALYSLISSLTDTNDV